MELLAITTLPASLTRKRFNIYISIVVQCNSKDVMSFKAF